MKIILTILISLSGYCVLAQHSILNSKWKGHIDYPQSLDLVLEFKKDTVIVTSADGQELESMFFSQNKDTVIFRKLNGTSPCDYVSEGFYHIEWQENGDKFKFHMLRDNCSERAGAITSAAAYFRIKE